MQVAKLQLKSRLKLLVEELKDIYTNRTEVIVDKLREIVKEYRRTEKKSPTVLELFELIGVYMNKDKIKWYLNGALYYTEEDKNYFSVGMYLEACHISVLFRSNLYKERLRELCRTKQFDKKAFHNNVGNYLKLHFPEIQNAIDSQIPYLRTIGVLKGLRSHLDDYIPRMNDFVKCMLLVEWNIIKKDLDEKIPKIIPKKVWTITFKGERGYRTFRERIHHYKIPVDKIPNKYQVKIRHTDLVKIFESLRHLRFKIV